MKRCNACDAEFEDNFIFCPVDATPLSPQRLANTRTPSNTNRAEFHLTLIDNAGLVRRLAVETEYLNHQLKLAWPKFKRDPIGFAITALAEVAKSLQRKLATPNAVAALATSMLIVISAVLLLIAVGNFRTEEDPTALGGNEVEIARILDFRSDTHVAAADPGIGAGSKEGRVGFAGGRGEGSGAALKKSSGGGSGGDRDPLPVPVGKLPPPSEIPAPIPKFPPIQKQALPAAGLDIDPALWKNFPMANYGDPRSQSTTPSSGPGEGGGMGTVTGTGIGDGKGPGFGPGEDGNIGGGRKDSGCCGSGGSHGHNAFDLDKVYPTLQVSERARVLAKPEPQYTEEARRNAVSGTVVLRVVFSRTGEVTNIRAVQSLPFGLTERAIAAARQIRFRPATRDGHPVNVYMQLEYNFNLY